MKFRQSPSPECFLYDNLNTTWYRIESDGSFGDQISLSLNTTAHQIFPGTHKVYALTHDERMICLDSLGNMVYDSPVGIRPFSREYRYDISDNGELYLNGLSLSLAGVSANGSLLGNIEFGVPSYFFENFVGLSLIVRNNRVYTLSYARFTGIPSDEEIRYRQVFSTWDTLEFPTQITTTPDYFDDQRPRLMLEKADGNFWVVGDPLGGTNAGLRLSEFDSLAKELRVIDVATPEGMHFSAREAYLDPLGSIILGGLDLGPNGNIGRQASVLKLDPNGNYLWHCSFHSSDDDKPFDALRVGPDGECYLFSHATTIDLQSGTAFVTRVDWDGTLPWEASKPISADHLQFEDAAIDDQGDLYLAYSGNASQRVWKLAQTDLVEWEVSSEEAIAVWPNPIETSFEFRIIDPTTFLIPYEFSLHDVAGRVILTESQLHTSGTIEVGNLPSGIYFYQWVDRTGNKITGKLLKN